MILSKKMWLLLLLLLFIFGILYWWFFFSNVEEPGYDVSSTHKSIEIRRYNPMLVAEVTETGDRQTAISRGFRVLADYIFGNNTVQQKIAMTAPVSQTKSEKIQMTAPVVQAPIKNAWKIQFIMPKTYQLEKLPKPKNKRIQIKQVPEQKRVVIQFSGQANDVKIKQKEQELFQYIEDQDLEVASTVFYAFYNPPWTPAFLRRNEIMLVVK